MCDTIVIVAGERVLFAKNSDRDPNEAQRLEWHPRRQQPASAMLRCTWMRIPDVRQTHAVLLSRPYWMWGAEMGANECGVTIGNEAVFTTEPIQDIALTGMDLVRLALERAATAAAAVEVITELIETHGQGGACGFEYQGFTYHNSFAVADPTGAFILETAGRKWQVERVSGARTISNGLTIPAFARSYQNNFKTRFAHAEARRCRTQALANDARTATDLMAILRDHGEGRSEPDYGWLNGAVAAPCMHAGGLVSLGSQTTASWVSDLTTTTRQHWATGTSAPCTSLFKPVNVHEPVDLGLPALGQADKSSLWWRHERFHRRVVQAPMQSWANCRDERDQLEAEWLRQRPSSTVAFARADTVVARWQDRVTRVNERDTRPWLTRRFWRKRNARARLPTS